MSGPVSIPMFGSRANTFLFTDQQVAHHYFNFGKAGFPHAKLWRSGEIDLFEKYSSLVNEHFSDLELNPGSSILGA